MFKRFACAAAVVLLFVTAAPAVMFTGSIAAPAGSGINTTGGAWLNSPSVTLSWVVSENLDGTWHYEYTFTTPSQGALSHIIIELSGGVTANDFVGGLPSGGEINTYGPGDSANPNIPGTVYGLKINGTGPFAFDINRAPTWGDFYAKDGNAGGGQNTAWNTGFASLEASGLGNDPESIPPHDGPDTTVGFHILVPDSQINNLPEPASLVLVTMGSGCFGLLAWVRRRRAGRA